MRTHKPRGPIMPGTSPTVTLNELEAPKVPGYAFLGGTGWIGVQCACGAYFSARTMAAVQAAVSDHQTPAICTAAAEVVRQEDESIIDD